MKKKREPYKLTITLDDAGVKAEAVYRTRVFGDDGIVDATFDPVVEPVRLADIEGEFPWKEFIDAATQAALTSIGVSAKAKADAVTAAEDTHRSCDEATAKANSERDAAVAERNAVLKAALDKAQAEVNEKTARIAELEKANATEPPPA